MNKQTLKGMVLSLLSVGIITACDSASNASAVTGNEASDVLQARNSSCEVTASSLSAAKRLYSEQCGGSTRDCDPVDGQWLCANYVIGTRAPTESNVDNAALPGHSSDSQAVAGSCTVQAASLSAARDAYAEQCNLPRLDCDPIEGVWFCSSQQLGSGSPNPTSLNTNPTVFNDSLEGRVKNLIDAHSAGQGLAAFTLPETGDFAAIPQDPNNPITPAKVTLGRLLFHDTSFALEGRGGDQRTWSCATCHHAAAGFKSGTRQGIGNGGVGFGSIGADRVVALGFDHAAAADDDSLPDFQPLASPTILHSAWQDVMLWNGQFGNSENGIINAGVDPGRLLTPGTPKESNSAGLAGVEVQAIAGSGVHRLKFSDDTPLQNNSTYQTLWHDAYGNEPIGFLEGAAKAMAAFERTVIANEAPFQRWIRGESAAMTELQLRGAELFFGSAGCVDCHRGPGLGSDIGAMPDNVFFSIGFADIDHGGQAILGTVDEATRLGRGGFTGVASDNYKFKIPQLYNLTDANVFGHGASFDSVRAVVEYKNLAIAQNPDAQDSLDYRFQALSLSSEDVDALTAFVSDALNDPNLQRYEPDFLPGNGCIVVNAQDGLNDGRCP
ncbi:MAG: cytochrome-c peroxidase [Granulosicoccus sp.]